jgi:hypothetical protein
MRVFGGGGLCWQVRKRMPAMLTWFNLKSPSLPVLLLQLLSGTPYFGAVVGRVANRVASGKFKLEGKEYTLEQNNGPNALHGTQLVLFLAAWERAGGGGGGCAWVDEWLVVYLPLPGNIAQTPHCSWLLDKLCCCCCSLLTGERGAGRGGGGG